MDSRRIKIIVILLVLAAAVAAAVFLRPKRFHVDQTQYELISLHKPEYRLSEVFAINRSGVALGWVVNKDNTVEIVKWDSNGTKQTVPISEDIEATPRGINDNGDIVGHYQDRKSPAVVGSFRWDSIRGFQSLPVYDTLQYEYSDPRFINQKGQIAGFMTKKSPPYKQAVFYFDPEEGVCDIGSLGAYPVTLRGMNEKGMVVGSSRTTGNAEHAFLWTKRNGMIDIHSLVAPQAKLTRAFAISPNGWILVQAINQKRHNRIIWYHPEKGVGPSFSFNEWIMSALPVTENRFVFHSLNKGWMVGRFNLRQSMHNNWILDYGQNPVLISPKVLSDQPWSINSMTDQGIIVGSYVDRMGNPFLLRPIRPGDSGKK